MTELTSPAPSARPTWWTFERTLVVCCLIAAIVILLPVLIAVVAAFFNIEGAVSFIGFVRNIATTILFLEGILIVMGLGIVLVQVARFVNLLRSEVKPIAQDTKETLSTVRTTTEFVGKQAVEPLIALKSFASGFVTFMQAMFGIRALMSLFRKQNKNVQQDKNTPPQ